MEPWSSSTRPIGMRGLVVLGVIILLAACGSQPGDFASTGSTRPVAEPTTATTDTPDPAEPQGVGAGLEAARAKWDAAGLDTYTFRFLDDCGECEQRAEQSVVVWDGVVQDPLGHVRTVEEAFDLIEHALSQDIDVDVTFDPQLGYPTDLWIDPGARAYDGGTHLLYGALEPGLPGERASLDAHTSARARWEEAGLTSYEYSSAVVCQCAYEVSMHTTVVNGRVTDFDYRTPGPTNITFSPLTIVQMFDDVEAFLTREDFPEEGISVTGSALYDDVYGYPSWIGLDIEVADPEAAAEVGFPNRLVMTVSDLRPLSLDPDDELTAAQDRWEAAQLDDYTFDIVFHDIAAGDYSEAFTVRVESDRIVSVSESGYEHPPKDVEIFTIDELFVAFGRWRLEGRGFDVIFDAELGYPAVVITDEPEGSVSISLRR